MAATPIAAPSRHERALMEPVERADTYYLLRADSEVVLCLRAFLATLDTQGCCRGNGIARTVVDHLVDDSRSFSCPLLDRHRMIRDDVLAHHMLDVLHVTPTLGISVLQPDKCSADVGRTVLGVVHDDRLFAPSWHEDFHCSVVVQLRCAVWTGVTRDTRPNCDIGQALNPWVAVC
jgi:hypothetical protein